MSRKDHAVPAAHATARRIGRTPRTLACALGAVIALLAAGSGAADEAAKKPGDDGAGGQPPVRPTYIEPPPLPYRENDVIPESFWRELPSNQWVEAPDSKLVAQAPKELPPGLFSNLFDAWNGGALDTKRQRLLIFGGGHAGYAGNEVYAFSFAHLRWARIWGPSALKNITERTEKTSDTYADGNPASRHTYGGLAYAEVSDDLVVVDGSLWWSGEAASSTWLFNGGTGKWTQALPGSRGSFGNTAVYDPVTKKIYVRRGNHRSLTEFDPMAKTFATTANNVFPGSIYGVMTLIPKRRLIVLFVKKAGITTYNLSSKEVKRVPFAAEHDGIAAAHYPGFVYADHIDRIVLWAGDEKIHLLNPEDWSISTIVPRGPKPARPSNGTFGRMQYVPAKEVLAIAGKVSENVRLLKISRAAKP